MPVNTPTISTMPTNPAMPATPLPDNALAELKPLIEPAAVSWWPLAPGWWVLGALLLGGVIALLIWSYKRWRRHQRTRYQREALAMLETVQHLSSNEKKLHDAALILRRAVICAWGREQAGTMTWEAIFARHNPCVKNNTSTRIVDEANITLLMQSLYRQQAPGDEAVTHLLAQLASWLVTLPPVDH